MNDLEVNKKVLERKDLVIKDKKYTYFYLFTPMVWS